ncbi:class I SAM-dependent RNA methyltransferase [Jannaschia donghaensis]|uniref:23S rRNA (Uracil(1939)-C(5))-methyltransferase RlmD n=1 Tax=Jannaschia donghaensis TaxID=420998 RepID=A0A0M6YK36_9RHOB|nr:class I SAM-dependent RNA methyltransferase [Jannaschia donghaensis]CTQ49416.1 23S rRNA (uracil(1939)-C(5))-methyltransferase RlmD [Jannaschia donghaensis]
MTDTHIITRLGHHGDGIAQGPDGPLFAARTLPGEEVSGEVSGDRIPAPKIVTPSTERVAAPCRHYKRCGGCSLQHASDAFVADWKMGIVRDTLARAGIEAQIAGIETSPPNSRRRAALSGLKTKKGALVGFHVAGGSDVVDIPGCTLLTPALIAALPRLEQITRLAATRGAQVTLHVTETLNGIDLAIAEAKPFGREEMLALAPLAPYFARITWNGEPALQQSPPRVAIGRARVTPPPGAFLQATEAGQAALTARVVDIVAGADRVVDLFAGCGTFTFPVAETTPVHAVEGERALTEALVAGRDHATGLKAITAEVRDLFRNPILPEDLTRFDAAVIDPPRAGAQAQVAQLVRSANLSRIAFVSCNPGTFACDAATLVQAGWRMGPVTVVDQFRWSPHVELVAAFHRT